MNPLTYLRDAIDDNCRDDAIRSLWFEFSDEIEIDGLLDGLAEPDGCALALALLVDLGTNADGCAFLRWRADHLRDGGKRLFHAGPELIDPEATAGALDGIAHLAGTKPRTQT